MKLLLFLIVASLLNCTSCGEKHARSNKTAITTTPIENAIGSTTLSNSSTSTTNNTNGSKNIPAEVIQTTNNNTTATLANYTQYSWLDTYHPQSALQKQIPTPPQYTRTPSSPTSFGTWLRGLPLLPKTSKVMLYNGTEKPYQEGAFRVLDIDIGQRDLQQCADAVMRLVAEYHYSKKDYDAIHFNYTSGHTIRFSDWVKGKKPIIKGSKVSFSAPNNSHNTSYKNFKKYLTNIYCYAGTASLAKELKAKAISNVSPGDVFIWGGFPGHAVIVLDVAQHETTGKKIFLLAQSYMPAQSIHVLHNFNDSDLSPWYSEDFGAQLVTPEWTFDRNTLKSFDID